MTRTSLTLLVSAVLMAGAPLCGDAGEGAVPVRRGQGDARESAGASRETAKNETDEDDSEPGRGADLSKTRQGMLIKTLGGRQFWGDVHYFHGWKIQRNVFTGHYRLLDADDFRHTWGSRDECLARLEEIRKDRKLPPMKGKAVVVVHGIIRSSKSFGPMKAALEKAGYEVFGFDYPSTQVSIPESAEYLDSCLKSLEGIEEINFVVHSMGGLVVRSYLASHADKRIGRMVMMGVPNNGAEMADLMKTNPLFRVFYGPAGQQLVTGKDGLIATLPTPDFEFAVLAGARGTPDGFNPLIAGDDDGTVRVESTRLPGACDFGTVKCLHSLMMNDPSAIDQTTRFLKEGKLREKGEKQPIPKEQPVPKQQPAAQATRS